MPQIMPGHKLEAVQVNFKRSEIETMLFDEAVKYIEKNHSGSNLGSKVVASVKPAIVRIDSYGEYEITVLMEPKKEPAPK